jgi:hypothetical protein
MSVTVTTGVGSLISVGFGVTDVANLYALGKRVGNWVTATSGDAEFLDLLQSDELELLSRRGMIDVLQFNARWGQRARLLMNGRPTELVGDDAAKVLDTLSRFTASMVAVVAALDGFMNYTVLKEVMKRLLKELLRTTEYGEDVLSSQLNDRVNAWRSASYLRGLSIAVQRIREEMVMHKKVLDGYMPPGEAQLVADFLYWLLSGSTELLTTASSDVAGIAMALSQVGFDVLSVEGWGIAGRQTSCRVLYMPVLVSTKTSVPTSLRSEHNFEEHANLWREQSTTVSLTQPEESMSAFPITKLMANEVRQAWSEGQKAASAVRWRVKTSTTDQLADVEYELIDQGSPTDRVRDEIFALAKDHSFCVNAEFCERLAAVFPRRDAVTSATLSWIHDQSIHKETSYRDGEHISHPEMQDQDRIDAFTIYQAFLLGYYYASFLPFVDTTKLAIQTVSGAWGYRSAELLDLVREHAITKDLDREGMQIILAALCFSQIKQIPDLGLYNRCLGIIGKRALLVNSLVAASDSPQAVGSFTLLDVAVGHIPSDSNGLIRSGHAVGFCEEYDFVDPSISSPHTVVPAVPDEDFTKHIEPDWDGNPEKVLLVMRYKGRRIATINPADTDKNICRSYVESVDEPQAEQQVSNAIDYTVQHFLTRRCFYPKFADDIVVVVHSKKMPGVRYTAVSAYPQTPYLARRDVNARSYVALASNCVVAAAARQRVKIIVA